VIGDRDPSDLVLLEISRPDALFFGVPEKTVAERVEQCERDQSSRE